MANALGNPFNQHEHHLTHRTPPQVRMTSRKRIAPDAPQPHPTPPSPTTRTPARKVPQYLIDKTHAYYLTTRNAQFQYNEDRRVAIRAYFKEEGDRIRLRNHYATHGSPRNEDGSLDEAWFENSRHHQVILCDNLLDSMAARDAAEQATQDSYIRAVHTQRQYHHQQTSIRNMGIPSTIINHRHSQLFTLNPTFNE
jgi:hypothetical protein